MLGDNFPFIQFDLRSEASLVSLPLVAAFSSSDKPVVPNPRVGSCPGGRGHRMFNERRKKIIL